MTSKYALNESINLLNKNIEIEIIKIAYSSGSSPRTSDALMIIYKENNEEKNIGTIGGGLLEFKAMKDGFEYLSKKENGYKTYNLNPEELGGIGMICGGSVKVDFLYLNSEEGINTVKKLLDEEFSKENFVYIFGGGHVSLDLADLLYKIGFKCIVIDDREEFANKDRFPNAYKILVEDYDKIFEKINITKYDYIVILTRGHIYDYIVEKNALKTDAIYIGMIGSKNKIKNLHNKLKSEEGYNDETISRVNAPIGLQIGAETTEEIAVSIAAELILKRAAIENRRKIKKL